LIVSKGKEDNGVRNIEKNGENFHIFLKKSNSLKNGKLMLMINIFLILRII